ncbi:MULTISPECIES: tripartite tricarboxylate transporter substrate binding protein [unclassified Bradyrhizobium]|uniref:Bug family tripartite tricarboxylate transporter substrate binding protein n=1 Tax=unclassified Bradyrhizobium TaxID=2631580 RepID=UPI001BA61F01|nr:MULTISPECIES: tripartite tricarboxylate transporter substrate binding protein [unclassified Bradyrhizobium]MBR1157286.1 tripartite tricarboxylate transporter substrate binding protein [Bradyrhizobium sp. JYMT SZCCT0428]MBR1237473.1 tripartite tricarboxylate transporter substrate binding protein [Bradyrhizobium sp. AUGA SZCCT0182]
MSSIDRGGIKRRSLLEAGTAALVTLVSTQGSLAEPGYPLRPVHVIVPFAPGGGADILARQISWKLSERLGQQFYVQNIAGASGNLGTARAARAAPDGSTILFVFGSFVISPSLFANPGFDPKRDFAPVTLAATTPTVLVVNPSIPTHTVGELIDHIRANTGNLNFAHGGMGTQGHLVGEQFRLVLNLDLVNVPFGGAAPATASVVAGHTPIGFISLAAVYPQVNEGRLRALAVTGPARAGALPEVPTMSEAGFPDIVGDSWVGVLVPTGTPEKIITLLHREIVAVINEAETKARLMTLGYNPVASTPDEFAQLIGAELQLWKDVIRRANIKPR